MTQTIRQIGGARNADRIDPASTALVLIDFQNEYFDGRLPIPDGQRAIANAARLVHLADRHGIAVFHVQHIGAAGGPLFADGSPMAEIHPALPVKPQHQMLRKSTTSTFASTDLEARLRSQGIRTLLVAGLMTHMCISTAVRDARQFGARSFEVIVAADACATRDLPRWDGGVLPHSELHEATLTALSDNFAQILRTDAILDLPLEV